MHITEALSLAAPLREVVVAILDTGIDTEGALLSDRVYDKVSIVNSSDSVDASGHGTHVAGTVAIIAPNCSIFDVKVADNRGNCTSSDVAEGIRRAVSAGATVINLSLEVDASPELEEAVHYAWQRGALLVAAAGMPTPGKSTVGESSSSSSTPDGPCRPSMSPCVYPAAYQEVVAVTGTNQEGELAPVCNRGTWVDVAAPGLKTFSELPGGTHGYMTGTSTAAAHVSGLAALLCGLADDENRNGRVNDEVRLAIEATSRPLGIEGTGNGIVDAEAAVRYIQR
jgi:thermitase